MSTDRESRRHGRPYWSFAGTPEARLPGGLYARVHSSLCATRVSGHTQSCNCEPVYQHLAAPLGEGER